MVTNYAIFAEMPTGRNKCPITRFSSENPHVDFRQGFVADRSFGAKLASFPGRWAERGPFPFYKTLQNYF